MFWFMDEPFVGLDPINVALLKDAFVELRDRGKTLVFSTHQLDQAEELCDSVAIIDHGRIVTAGPTRDVKPSAGHQVVRVETSADGDLAWLRSLPHVKVTRPGQDYTEVRVDAGADPQAVLRAAIGRAIWLRSTPPVGVLDIRAGWVTALSQVPFVSPFMMVGRITSGQATVPEVLLSIALLAVCIVGTLWLPARIYRAGVLLYGQRPGVGAIFRLVRSAT